MKRLLIILSCILLSLATWSQTLSDQSVVSLLSCSPGKPLYFHYGHAAIRVQDPAMVTNYGDTTALDWTFNYGIFDFGSEDFYLKFVKGETDYMLGLEYTSSFIASASYSDREVSYQPLQLTLEERQAVFDALMLNYQPENRYYRYNFVYDNCATRPWHILKRVLNASKSALMVDEAELQQSSGETWRKIIDHYTGKWSWAKYGINLVFGYEADQEMTVEQTLFLPERLMYFVSNHGMTDDEDIHAFIPRDSQFATSPELLTLLLCLLIAGVTIWNWKKKHYSWWLDETLYIVYFMLGLIVAVLYFFSEHPFVGSNMNILYLNPLWIIPIVLLCKASWREAWLRCSTWILTLQAVCILPYLYMGQTLHPILVLLFVHSFRTYWLHKNQ